MMSKPYSGRKKSAIQTSENRILFPVQSPIRSEGPYRRDYSHSIIQKCSAFLISLSVCPWWLPVIGCILLASSSENSSQTQLFRILSCREFSARVLQEGRITVRPAGIHCSRHSNALHPSGAFPRNAVTATVRFLNPTVRASFWPKLERLHSCSLKAFCSLSQYELSDEREDRWSSAHRYKRICSRLPIDALPRVRQTPHRGTPAHGQRGAVNEAARKTRDSPNR